MQTPRQQPSPGPDPDETIDAPTRPAPQDGQAATIDGPSVQPSAYLPRIEGYQIVGRLGEGGMGVVWRAVQASTHRQVALKMMSAAGFGSERARLRFQREVDLTARLEHPHIARVYEGGEREGICYYAMELIEGRPLNEYVAEAKLSRRQILELMRVICEAVQHAHQKGVIHRDLKPSNILVDAQGQPHVLDFGLAKATGDDSGGGQAVSVDGQVAGTPAYMSPEQAAGHTSEIDTRSDVYTLGVILFQLLSGQFPHDVSGTALQIVRRIAEQEPKRLSSIEPRADRELEALLGKALAREPERRYGSAAGLAADLGRYLSGDPLIAQPPTATYLLKKKVRKHWLALSVTAAVLIVLLGTAAWAYVRVTRERNTALAANAEKERQRREADAQRQRATESEAAARASEAHAESQRQRAEEQKRIAEDQKLIAEKHARETQVQLANGLVAQGDVLLQSAQWLVARQRYQQAYDLFTTLALPTTTADYGLWASYAEAPPPLVECTPFPGQRCAAAFLPDGRTAVVLPSHGPVALIDVFTGRTLRELPGALPAKSYAGDKHDWLDLAVLDGGRSAVLANRDGSLALADLQQGTLVRTFGEPAELLENYYHVASDGGRRLVQARGDKSGNELHVYGLPDGRLIHTFPLPFPPHCVALAPDGTTLACGGGGARCELRRIADGSVLRLFQLGGNEVGSVAFSPDGSRLAIADYAGVVELWNPRFGQRLASLKAHRRSVHGMHFSRDGSILITAGFDGAVRSWDGRTGRPIRALGQGEVGVGSMAGSMAASPDGKRVLLASARLTLWATDPPGEAYDVLVPVAANPLAAFSPAGDLALILEKGRGLYLVDVRTRRVLNRMLTGRDFPIAVTFRSDGLRAISADVGRVTQWDLRTGSPVWHFEFKRDGPVGFAISPDERTAALVDRSGVRLLQTDDGALLRTLPLPPGRILARPDLMPVAFTPDGKGLLLPSDPRASILLLDGSSPPLLLTETHRNPDSFAISRDGRTVAIGHSEAGFGVDLCDCVTRQRTASLGPFSASPRALAFTADGRLLLVGCLDGVLNVVDVTSGQVLRAMSHDEEIQRVAWSTDGRRAISTSREGATKVWDFGPMNWYHRDAELKAAWDALRAGPSDAAGEPQRKARQLLGEWFLGRGACDLAAEYLEAASADGGADAVPLPLLAQAHLGCGDFAKATAELREACNRGQADSAYAQVVLACLEPIRPDMLEPETVAAVRTLVAQGRDAEAIAASAGLAERFPENQEHWLDLAGLHGHAGDYPAAVRDLQRCVEVADFASFRWKMLALAQLFVGDQTAYRRTCNELLVRLTPSADALDLRHAAIAVLLAADGGDSADRAAAACTLADRALAKQPTNGWTQFAKALADYRRGNWDAIARWRGMSSPFSTDPVAQQAAGVLNVLCLARSGRRDEALAEWRTTREAFEARVPATPDSSGGPTALDDWFVARILYREAEAVFDPPPLPATRPTTAP